jgi:hypothetical protein
MKINIDQVSPLTPETRYPRAPFPSPANFMTLATASTMSGSKRQKTAKKAPRISLGLIASKPKLIE